MVPSITESLFVLGFGDSVIGVTDYCTEPKRALQGLVRVGGPKTPDIQKIISLNPDLVIVEQDENEKESVLALAKNGVPIWLSHIKTVNDSLAWLRNLLGLFRTDASALMVETLQKGVDYAREGFGESGSKFRYFCPIWYQSYKNIDWWMTFNNDTYPADVLNVFGGENIFGDRKRLYPLEADLGMISPTKNGEGDNRYPRVTVQEIVEKQPDVILLPDDPYKFNTQDEALIYKVMANTPAVKNDNIIYLEGSLIMWFGVRLGKALQDIPQIISAY